MKLSMVQSKDISKQAYRTSIKTSSTNFWFWVILAHVILAIGVFYYFHQKIERIDQQIETIKQK